jgi:hypothetical protein
MEQALSAIPVEPWTDMNARAWWELHAPETFSK